jgi:IclR family KDG regulon transcriptional repressor
MLNLEKLLLAIMVDNFSKARDYGMRDPNDYNVRAVERALQILECFDDDHPERGISEISEAIGLHKATTFRILTTLLNSGYIERTSTGEKYRLGLMLSDLGFKVIRRMDLRQEAFPLIQQLVQQLDEICDLSVFDHGRVFYVDVIQSRHALTIAATPGQRLPAHCTASGKVFLAYLPSEKLATFLNTALTRYTSKTITEPDHLRLQLETFRQQGYAIDDEEYEIGIWGISAPVFNYRGNILAAVSVLSPTSRITPERIDEITHALKETTQAISRRMGMKI